jgi:hypothetical protein
LLGCALLPVLFLPAALAEPSAPPTQSVPMGVRPLLSPPVVLSAGAFEVDAPDHPSALAVLDLAQHLRTLITRDLPWPDFPDGAIQIQLIPAARANFSGPFAVRKNQDDTCSAFVRWGPNTALSDVCLALGNVMVESVATWRRGPAVHAPDWLKLAFGKMLEVESKPAIMDEFSADARRQPILSLRQIMTAQNPSADDLPLLALNAYWLACFLEDQCVTSANAVQLFGPLASGADPAQALTKAFPGRFVDARDLELWWEVGYRDIASQHLSLVLSMAQSRALLDRMEYADLPRPNGAVQRTRLDDAWASRTDPTLQQHLTLMMLNAGSLPLQINPVYKNALLSLLRTLTQMSGNDDKTFRAAWTQYLADRADAEADEAGVEKALSTP